VPTLGAVPTATATAATEATPISGLKVLSPLANERFIQGEKILFQARVTRYPPVDGSEVKWSSSISGLLGTGTIVRVSNLGLGNHTITVSGYGYEAELTIRVFSDLSTLYVAPISAGEMERISNHFQINLVDGPGTDESWAAYTGKTFDQRSEDPSVFVAIANIDALRHQRFAEPLPFVATGETLYDHVRKYTKIINLRLDCGNNSAGGNSVNLNRKFSIWVLRLEATRDNPDACKAPLPRPPQSYTSATQPYPPFILIHENRHNEPDDPRHTTCAARYGPARSIEGDQQLEAGSGFAQSALYLMWVFKYGTYDPPAVKQEARVAAIGQLTRLCTRPTHTNRLVQTLLDELLAPYIAVSPATGTFETTFVVTGTGFTPGGMIPPGGVTFVGGNFRQLSGPIDSAGNFQFGFRGFIDAETAVGTYPLVIAEASGRSATTYITLTRPMPTAQSP
jgi:hypothetical protein